MAIDNKIFLPAQFRYKNICAWNTAIEFQKEHNNHTQCVVINNADDQHNALLSEIIKMPEVYNLCRRNQNTYCSSWNVRVQRTKFQETYDKISNIITQKNTS